MPDNHTISSIPATFMIQETPICSWSRLKNSKVDSTEISLGIERPIMMPNRAGKRRKLVTLRKPIRWPLNYS